MIYVFGISSIQAKPQMESDFLSARTFEFSIRRTSMSSHKAKDTGRRKFKKLIRVKSVNLLIFSWTRSCTRGASGGILYGRSHCAVVLVPVPCAFVCRSCMTTPVLSLPIRFHSHHRTLGSNSINDQILYNTKKSKLMKI